MSVWRSSFTVSAENPLGDRFALCGRKHFNWLHLIHIQRLVDFIVTIESNQGADVLPPLESRVTLLIPQFAKHQHLQCNLLMLSSKILALCAVAALAGRVQADDDYSDNYDEGSTYADSEYSALPAFAYTFDPEYSAGVSGTIKVQYAGPFSTFAVISAELDFSDVDQSEIMAFNGNCTEEVTEYKWHIHVKWPHDSDSESFEQCALPITGNHYDPLKACSPDSEFTDTPECQLRSPLYDCNPDDYAKDPLVCEKGDLAGKLGLFELDDDKQVSSKWFDPNYPQPSENTPEWNIILHAVCGKVAPRIACAVGKAADSDWSWGSTSGSYYRH